MGGGEEHMFTAYSQNKVFKITPKQTIYFEKSRAVDRKKHMTEAMFMKN